MPSSSLLGRATLAGAVTGVAVTVVLVVAGPLRLPARGDRADATAEFLAAWARSRRGTYLVRGTFERRQSNGAVLSGPYELVQRPPDRLVRRLGSVTGTVGGKPVACSSDTGAVQCVTPAEDEPPPADYEAAIQEELDAFRQWFTPPGTNLRPRYRVVADAEPGCFDLILAVPGVEAPYGTDARLCFDDATGAPRLSERRFENGVIETERAEAIVATVSDADLALPR